MTSEYTKGAEDIDLELLASMEHEQWAHWTLYMLGNLTPENIQRWHRQSNLDYADLSEKEKESDRDWAKSRGVKLEQLGWAIRAIDVGDMK